MEDQPFYRWLSRTWKRWVPASASLSLPPLSYFLRAPDVTNWPWFSTFLLGLQAAVILILIACLKPPAYQSMHVRASLAANQFYKCWKRIWFMWLILYLAMAGYEALSVDEEFASLLPAAGAGVIDAILNAANNCVSVGFFMCYIVLAERTVSQDGEGPHADELPWLLGFGVVAALFVVELVVVLAGWPSQPAFKWITGLIAGLGIAVVVGRLDSKYFGVPVTVIGSLYFYAVIQPGWPQFGSDGVRLALLTAALPLKIVFFLVVKWSFDTGRFVYYAARMGTLVDEVEVERGDFLRRLAKPPLHPVPKKARKASRGVA